ncbi:MAG: D-alanyl-D-alanine carboxypeptidase/D-alanyl-D-alanine-endopeptidase, partial [Candidatus Eremiobacteraeota bacterium]|nr:D-alanyl-D-alanine carboxypeptidase/D-alanyl-D-alanine-endopeptidase [Candidatus Eremiobacteraeota bacterium]
GGPERNPLWDPADAYSGFSAATSAVSLDQDTIEFHVSPAAAGAPARVTLEPPNRVVTFTSSVVTVPSGYANSVIITPLASENAYTVTGQIAASGHQTIYYLPVSRIPNYVANVVESMLEARGIDTMRGGRSGIAGSHAAVLWDHPSPPLRFIVRKMLFESNNHIAEQLLRTVGRSQSVAGDDQHGVQAEAAYLRSLQVPVSEMRVVDGSGLAAANRVSALTLSTLLSREERTPGGNPLYLELPRGGIEGTVRFYHFGTAMGRVRAKSGHLSGVDALAGYVSTHRHGRLAFAFLVDANANQWMIDDAIARAVDRLADF